MSDHDDGGDEPDTIDGRLAGIARLIDTIGDELDDDRRRRRRAVIVTLLTRVAADVLAAVALELDRVDQDDDR